MVRLLGNDLMATRFLKLDLSKEARDFEPVALRLGVALLDRQAANYRVLNEHLGRLIAEPEFLDDDVSFYVSDESGARFHNVQCEPVSAKDLAAVKTLRLDFESLKKQLHQHTSDSDVFTAAACHFDVTATATGSQPVGNHFFRYRDEGGKWRLVWCWGYQRSDNEPADPKICTNPSCRQLFVRRRSGDRDCPGCSEERKNPASKKWMMVSGLLILLAAVGGFLVSELFNGDNDVPPASGNELAVIPPVWSAPSGSRLEYRVVRLSGSGEEQDVTSDVVPYSDDPKVVRFEKGTTIIHARSRGKTAVHFYLGEQQVHATVDIQPPRNPASVQLDPATITLGVGTTEKLTLRGDFGDGKLVDLTEMARWEPVDGSSVSCTAGRLEGIAVGDSTIVARYRATPDDPFVSAEAKIVVVDEEYSSLKIVVDPSEFSEGNTGKLLITVANQDGEQRSVLDSSLLSVEVDDRSVATVDGGRLRAVQAGKGNVTASLGELTASCDFTVTTDRSGRFAVLPKDLQLFVGELAELDVISASAEAIHVASSSPEIVSVETGTTVIGRSPGKATLTITQEARETTVEVEVQSPRLKAIAIVPQRLTVPVNRSAPFRIVAQTENENQFDMSPSAVTWERIPSAAIAELDVDKLEMVGRTPTDSAPEVFVARVGGLRAEGEVDVVPSALRIVLTPEGPVDLLVGQTTQLHAWVRYGDATRSEIDPRRIKWETDSPRPNEMRFDPSTATVVSVKSGGSLEVVGSFQGYKSNPVTLQSAGEKFSLRLRSDRSVIMVGDRGQFRAFAEGAGAEISLAGVHFESRQPDLLTIDPNTGFFRAIAAGKVLVGAKHSNATNVAVENIEIVPREQAQLILRPQQLKLLVNARQTLDVAIVSGDQEGSVSLLSPGRRTHLSIAKPGAVRWQAPVLTGLRPTKPFEISVEHDGKIARAVVEVLNQGGDLRVSPDHTRLSPGQSISPRVEQQVPGTDNWQEIDPAKISWEVPDGVRWTPARGTLRPRLTPDESSPSPQVLTAKYDDKTATMELEVSTGKPPLGELEVIREPDIDELSVGSQQRFAIGVRQGSVRVPAVGVVWQPAFENDFVRWNPPVLIAKRPGHEQILAAKVGDDRISFVTRTVPQPADPIDAPPPPTGKPSAVRIVSDLPTPIQLPVGSRFGAFRVEADYPGRPPTDVTLQAALRASPGGVIALVGGEVVGQKPGNGLIAAVFNGVVTKDHLPFEVVDELPLSGLTVSPESYQLKVGESVTLRVTGLTGDDENQFEVGEIGSRGDVIFESDAPAVLRADGPTITGLSVGQGTITVSSSGASSSVDVEVVPADQPASAPLVVSPQTLRLKVGESKLIGRDVTVMRRNADLSDQVDAESSDPDTVRVHHEDGSIEGVTAGRATITLQAGGQQATLSVLVSPDDQSDQGTVVVEPESGSIAVGEYADLRVFLVSDDGQRVDRTGSATLASSAPDVLSVSRNRVTGISSGNATIQASLPGIESTGSASLEVVSDEFTSLQLLPSPLNLAVGQLKRIRIQAIGPRGRRALGDHPDLKIAVSGSNPDAVELSGTAQIRGATPGEATLNVSWHGLQAEPVPVRVTEQPITGLRIEPSSTNVGVNAQRRLQVFATRGGNEQAVTADDGLQLSVDDTSVAVVAGNQAIRGVRPGSAVLTARLGSQRAAAQVTVVADSGRDRAADMPIGLRFIPDVMRLQLGVPGGTVRVVKVSAGGTVEDLDHRADFEISPAAGKEVISVKWTASGPVFIAKKVGEADVHARLGELATRRPLRVIVVDPSTQQQTGSQGSARLQVQPDPLRISKGESSEFRRVQLIPANGDPQDVDYRVESNNNNVVSTDGKRMRGVSSGQARVTVRPVGVSEAFADLKADVTVTVESPPPPTPENSRLVLKGPSRGTVGAPLEFHVELDGDERTRDVTHDGASLVLNAGQSRIASLEPGCVLVPSQAGTIQLKARYKDLVSNALSVTIDPPSSDFVKLEIEMDTQPMAVGERRSYKLWGYPQGNALRQDLTHLVHAEGSTSAKVRVRPGPGSDPGVVAHHAPSVVAGAAGTFFMRAELNTLRSDVIEIEVNDAESGSMQLSAQPSVTTIRVGENTRIINAFASSAGQKPRLVDAKWSCEDPSIASADPEKPGQFIGKKVGETRLTATFGGQSTTVELRVIGDAFRSVSIKEAADFQAGNRFRVTIEVKAANPPDSSVEYRVSTVGNPESGQWVPTSGGETQRFDLSSPPLKRGPNDTTYHLMLEARGEGEQVIARYPLSFRLITPDPSNPRVEQQP